MDMMMMQGLRYLKCCVVLHDRIDVKVVYIAIFRPLFQVDLQNGCIMDKVLTGAVFLKFP